MSLKKSDYLKDEARKRKLNQLLQERNQLGDALEANRKAAASLDRKRQKIAKKVRSVNDAIYDLKHENPKVPHVSDHAIVRYLERVELVDINDLKVKVAKHKDAVRKGNAVITVGEDYSVESRL